MKKPDEAEYFGALSERLERTTLLLLEQNLRKVHLTRQQYRLIWLLDERKEALPMGEIARYMGLTGGAVTSLVNHLISKGYLRRKRKRDDRRFSLIWLSAKARKRLEAIREKMKAFYQEALRVLPGAQRRGFLRSFNEVVSNLSNRAKT